jgi:Tfp pilus assembly protein PilE
MMYRTPQRGFTLLIAVILASVLVTVGLALSDIAYKQVILASTAKQSQYAFYAADAALECALFYDQEYDAFNTNPTDLTSLSCNGQNISFSSTGSSPKVTTFSIPCVGGGSNATVRVYKGNLTTPTHALYASGYNSCSATDPRRIERGIKVTY